jgi:DUF2892 family protein
MSSLKKNQSDWERVGRIVAAVVLINLGIAFEGTLGLYLGITALYPLITGISGWCPFCALLKRVAV